MDHAEVFADGRGTPKFIDLKAFSCGNSWPRREHSRKSNEFYELVRRVTDGPRVDVFSRELREGFGTVISNHGVREQFGGTLLHRWDLNGLSVELSVPVERLSC